jgi:uncharacterized protein YgbK (DUF1537 family)
VPENIPIETPELLESPPLPAPWPSGLLADIQGKVAADSGKVVVLDDDPTGTQTVYGIPVLTQWSTAALAAELQGPHAAFYILTNSRSLTSDAAGRLNREIGLNLKAAASQVALPVEVISRSDSTLRGHFPAEVEALAEAMEMGELPCLIVPCFFEGGRYTVNDIHYVAEGDQLVPAAQTPYADDAAFGYRHSNLCDWVAEKSAGRVHRDEVVAISLVDLRRGGPDRVTDVLGALKPGSVCVVNAAEYSDLEVFVLGLLRARAQGHRFLYRTAASFVRVRCGLAPRRLLDSRDLATDNRNGGLFVVGSYVPKTTAQVAALNAGGDIAVLEIDVGRLLQQDQRDAEVARVTAAMNGCIGTGGDVLLYTSRNLVKGDDAAHSLAIGRQVSESLIRVVQGLVHQPRYLVAKGGITSSEVATQGLGVQRAMILGQVLPGVPVWRLGEESRYPHLAYIVFPGNVGDADALVAIRDRLRPRQP